jgi:hypothetical protein
MEVGILVDNPPLGVSIWAKVPGDKIRIGTGFLGVLTHQLAARGAGIFKQGRATVGRKAIKSVAHGAISSCHASDFFVGCPAPGTF